jgi:copper chaperone
MTTLKIKGMSCEHCVTAATKALSALDGVKDVQIDLKTGMATYDEERAVDPLKVVQAIKKAGYEVDE